jgi:hypothetical protein
MVPVSLAVRVHPGGDSPGKPEGQTSDAAAGQTDDAAAVRPMMASVPSEAESADTTGHGVCWMPSSRHERTCKRLADIPSLSKTNRRNSGTASATGRTSHSPSFGDEYEMRKKPGDAFDVSGAHTPSRGSSPVRGQRTHQVKASYPAVCSGRPQSRRSPPAPARSRLGRARGGQLRLCGSSRR